MTHATDDRTAAATTSTATTAHSPAVYLADQVLLLTKRPTRVAEILDYLETRPRTVATLSDPGFIATRRLSMEIFQREVRR